MPTPDQAASRDELLAELLAASPPRPVPLALRQRAAKQAGPLAFAVFGGFFFLFGLLFCFLLLPRHLYREWQLLAADDAEAPGRITAFNPTHMNVNKTKVMHYQFEFQSAAGEKVSGDCYTTGTRWRVGSAVVVRYRPENPQVACPNGARLSETNATSLIVLVFPLAGGSLVAGVLIARRRTMDLLEHGAVAEALVVGLNPNGSRVNNQPGYEIILQRKDLPDQPIRISRYQPAVIELAQQRLASKQPVFVLYDPAKPRRMLLPETL